MKCGGLLPNVAPVDSPRAALAAWLGGLEIRCGGEREVTVGVRVDEDFLNWLVSSVRSGNVPRRVLVWLFPLGDLLFDLMNGEACAV